IDNKTEAGNQIAKLTADLNTLTYVGWREHGYNGEVVSEDIFPSEFYTNTQGELPLFYKFVDIGNIPISFDTSFIHQDIYNYIISKRNLKKSPADDIIEDASGIWQIVKLVIDKKV